MNENVWAHFCDPKNSGNLSDYNYSKMLGSPREGALIKLQILVEDQRVKAIGYKAYGALAIALMSWYSDKLKDKELEEIKNIEIETLTSHFAIDPVRLNNFLLLKEIHSDLIENLKGLPNARIRQKFI